MAASAASAKTPKPRRTKRDTERAVALAEANSGGRGGFVSGLNIDLGRINEEYVEKLKDWASRVTIYQRMGNDAKIAAGLRANILPIISAVKWTAEGGADEPRELLAANLLRQGNPALWCETSWAQRLYEMLLSLQYGVSLFGKVWDVDPETGLRFYRRLTYLHPRSLGGPRGPWEFDKSGTRLVAVHRAYKRPDGTFENDERIPVEDVFPVVWGMAGENWEGVPLIRPMYRAWVEKDLAQKIQMIDLQNRGVGIPMATLGPNDGAKEATTLFNIAKDMRGASKERQAILKSADQKVEYLTSQGEVLDATPIVSAKNNEFAAGGGTDFQQQGQTATGSRATGSVLLVSYMQEIEATRRIIQEQVNQGAGSSRGLAEELQIENYGPQKEYAYICGTCVSPTEQLDNVPNILDAIQKGGLSHDLSVENHVRKSMGIRPLTPDEFDKLKKMQAQNGRPYNVGGRPSEVRPTDVDDPRDDDMSRVDLQEKKTPNIGASPRKSNRAVYPWLQSTTA
jgi:hypothetical protein